MNSAPHGPELDRLSDLWAAQPESTCFAPLAEALRKRGALEQATAVATAGIASHPDYVPGRLVMARIYVDQGESESAEAEIAAAIALDRTNPVALAALANVRPIQAPSPDSTAPAHEAEPVPPPAAEPAEPAALLEAEPELAREEWAVTETTTMVTDESSDESVDDLPPDEEVAVAPDAEPMLTESLAMLYRGQGHLGQAVEVLDALVARAPDNAELAARRDAIRAEFDLTRPRPYDAGQSGGTPLREWLAGMASSRATPPAALSSFDAFYQTPATPPSEAGDLAAFQTWLRELGR